MRNLSCVSCNVTFPPVHLVLFPLRPILLPSDPPPGLTQSTTSKCINTNSINSTNNSTSTSSMPTPILRLRLHPHQPPHRNRPPIQTLPPQGHTQPPQLMPHQEPMHRQGRTALREVTTPHQAATMLRLGTTTPRQAMTHLEVTEHMIHRALTQQREATPHPHRMSRHPHTGNPCPSAMITLTTRQNPLIDSPIPTTLLPHGRCVCMCA